MAKDPAFLMYSKDWLEGTADMFPEEKGIYIDLLCNQHQRGYLPKDPRRLARLVGVTQEEFLKVWEGIKHKFIEEGEGLVNVKLLSVMGERKHKSHVNSISGTFRSVLSSLKLNKREYNVVRQQFSTDKWLSTPKQQLSEAISEWCSERLSERSKNDSESIGNGDAIEDVDVIKDGYVIENILDHLNSVLNTSYKPSTKKTQEVINARLNEGFTIADFKTVIDKKHKEWKGTEFEKFLRPETLFSNKFEGYLNQQGESCQTKVTMDFSKYDQ